MSNDPDLRGKTVLVTGASNGIGLVTAAALARMGARTVMVARDATRGEAARGRVREESGSEDVHLLLADLASLRAVQRLATEFRTRFDALHVLVNNAGAYNTQYSQTPDGYETTFAVNHLAYFALTDALIDMLKASAPARIVNVSSRAHVGAAMNFDDLHSANGYRGMRAYGQSKLANVLFTYELARRLQGTGVTANCLHPGVVMTGFGKNNAGMMRKAFDVFQTVGRPFLMTPEKGARTTIYLASSPEVEGKTGGYYSSSRPATSTPASHDAGSARRLWEMSEQMVAAAVGVSAPAS